MGERYENCNEVTWLRKKYLEFHSLFSKWISSTTNGFFLPENQRNQNNLHLHFSLSVWNIHAHEIYFNIKSWLCAKIFQIYVFLTLCLAEFMLEFLKPDFTARSSRKFNYCVVHTHSSMCKHHFNNFKNVHKLCSYV